MRPFLLLPLILGIAACHRVPDPAQAESCSGTTFVAVANHWTQAVYVYAWQDGRANVLGTVTAGSSGQFPMANRYVSVGARVEGVTSGAIMHIGPTSSVQTRIICR